MDQSQEINTGLRGWFVCLSAALFFFFEFIQMNMFSSIDPELMQAFSIKATALGQLASTYFLANVLFLFPAGIMLDRFSTRRIILTALAVCVIGTFLFSQATTFQVAIACRFFTGIGSAFCFLCCIRLASRWFPARRLALITGLVVTFAMCGGYVAQTPLALLVEHVGWRQALVLDASAGAIIWLFIAMVVQDHPPGAEKQAMEAREYLTSIGFWRSVRQSILQAQNWFAGLYTCVMNLPIALLGALWGSLYLVQVQHLTRTQASYVTGMVFIGTVIGSPLMGWLSDRIGKRRLPMFIGSLVSFALFVPLLLQAQYSLHTLMVIFFGLGLATSTQILSYPIVAESNPPSLTATSVSVVSTSVIGGGMLFQPFFGWIMDRYWDGTMHQGVAIYSPHAYHQALLIMPIGFVLSLLFVALLRRAK